MRRFVLLAAVSLLAAPPASAHVLRAGDPGARLVDRSRVGFDVCAHWTQRAWHCGRLLVAATEGRTLAIDTERRSRRVDLRAVTARFVPPGAIAADWANSR